MFLSTDSANGLSTHVMRGPNSDANELFGGDIRPIPLATLNELSGECQASGLDAAPQGDWLAVQVNCHAGSLVRLVNVHSGQVQEVGAGLGPDRIFLGWAPDSRLILLADVMGRPQVYLVDVARDTAEPLRVPDTTYNVALSPDGQRMLYSLTPGLGHGSETWIADLDGQNAQLVLNDPTHIAAYARWSPPGNKIAYLRMPDSNIPFTVGEVWVMDGDGGSPARLGTADAGHGYPPAWSLDGSQIAFVGQENGDDLLADQRADKLISDIYIADVNSGQIENVTSFSGALTENPIWSPDGDFLAFSSNAGDGGMGIWVLDVHSGVFQQVTHDANARYPTWLPIVESPAP